VPDLAIEPCDEADLPRLIAALGNERFLTRRMRLARRGHGVLLAAHLGGAPVGFVYLWLAPAEEPEVRRWLPDVPILNRLHVGPAYRRRGIGGAIVEDAVRRLRAAGHKQVALGVGPDNEDARRLYERLGFREWDHGMVTGRAEADLGSGRANRRRDETFMILVRDL
jgi:ribosomal protein S18 acetylase RimI-like enzyme